MARARRLLPRRRGKWRVRPGGNAAGEKGLGGSIQRRSGGYALRSRRAHASRGPPDRGDRAHPRVRREEGRDSGAPQELSPGVLAAPLAGSKSATEGARPDTAAVDAVPQARLLWRMALAGSVGSLGILRLSAEKPEDTWVRTAI